MGEAARSKAEQQTWDKYGELWKHVIYSLSQKD